MSLIDYDSKTETCIGFFDNNKGILIYKERQLVGKVIEIFSKYKWQKFYTLEKRKNNYYSKYRGWKLGKTVYRRRYDKKYRQKNDKKK